jgi:flagellar protein FliO/FliZ
MASSITHRSLALCTALQPVLAFAQVTAPPTESIGGNLLQLILGLAVVIALMFASLWLLKRLSAPRGEAAGLLRVVAGTAVGARERVVVLEVGGTWLVLGVAPGQVSALAEIPRDSVPIRQNAPQGPNFAGWLRRHLDRSNAR